jgi:outer membrane protein TolC
MRDYRKEVWIASGYACCLPALRENAICHGSANISHNSIYCRFCMIRFSFQFLFLFLLWACTGTLCANELGDLLQKAEAHNPTLQAARERVEQALLKHSELLEFFDPALFAAAGRATDYRALPLQSNYSVLGSNSFEVQGGVEVPIRPGAYVSVGAASRLLFEPEGYDRLYQNLFGVRVRVPLLRDRGFSIFGHRRSAAIAEYNQRASELLALSQSLRRDVEIAYIAAYENLSAYSIAQEASKRFEALVKVAKELAGFKTIPDYEVHSTERELQIGLEDVEKARNLLERSLVDLATLIGSADPVQISGSPDAIVQFAERMPALPDITLQQAMENRGEVLSILHHITLIQCDFAITEEQMKDDVYVHAGATLQAENTDTPFEAHRKISDDYLAGEVTLIWSRPLDYHGAKKRLTRFQSAISELKANLAQSELSVRQQLRHAELNFASARRRIELINNGMKAARETLESEQERFRLGEGASIDVLDAQKNLTIMLQRLTLAAADLLRARTEYLYAGGFEDGQEAAE